MKHTDNQRNMLNLRKIKSLVTGERGGTTIFSVFNTTVSMTFLPADGKAKLSTACRVELHQWHKILKPVRFETVNACPEVGETTKFRLCSHNLHRPFGEIFGAFFIRLFTLLLFTFLLCPSFLHANTPVQILEAENAELTLPSKVKYVAGYSGDAYVGDNDDGSSIVFKDVYIEKAGTYEFRTFYTSMQLRSIAIRSGYYPEVISTCPRETEDWNAPPVDEMINYIYLDEGYNTNRITPHNGGGPNIDKFEIWETTVSMPRPEIQKNAFFYDLTDDAIISENGINKTTSAVNDNNEYSVYQYNEASTEIYIECDMPYLLTGYLLSAGTENNLDVEDWKLEYSADGINYYTVTPSGHNDLYPATLYHIDRNPGAEQNEAARFYRLTAQGGAIGEVQLLGIPFLSNNNGKNFPPDITEGVDLLSNVIGNPLGTLNSFADERCFNLFDRNMSNKYYAENEKTPEVEIELNELHKLRYYTLTSCQDYPERDPKSWVVEGFDTDWEMISEVNDFYFPCRYSTMKFEIENDKKYKGFRLRVIENNGSDSSQFLKWQLVGEDEVVSSPKIIKQNQIEVYSQWGKAIIHTNEKALCRITDLSGRLIKQLKLNSEKHQVSLATGIYIITVISDTHSKSSKVMIR
jgi:hypothetical protein